MTAKEVVKMWFLDELKRQKESIDSLTKAKYFEKVQGFSEYMDAKKQFVKILNDKINKLC